MLKNYPIIIIPILVWNLTSGQNNNADTSKHVIWYESLQNSKLDSIGQKLANGDKEAFFEIAPYLDSTRIMNEWMGYERYQEEQKDIAQDFISGNCSFLPNELDISGLTASGFLNFLHLNRGKIIFDKDMGEFLITPLKKRDVKYDLQRLSDAKKTELKNNAQKLLSAKGKTEDGIAELIKNKDPLALYKIAAVLYRARNGYQHRPQLSDDECIALLELLTGTEIGVENDLHKRTTLIIRDYSPVSRLNLLIYFARYYQNYTWDNTLGMFRNPTIKVKPIDREAAYFELLDSKDDAIAMDAFIKLTTCNPGKVALLADEYERADPEKSYAIPTFPYRFLKQLTILTNYCNLHHIDFKGSVALQQNIAALKKNMSFAKCRNLEDKMINTLTLKDITAFEYWSIVYEKDSYLTFSAGRILDVFYSRNWNKITADPFQLNLYLKKSILFNRLGIIGICNKYINKFINSNELVLNRLRKNISTDTDIRSQIKKAIALNQPRKKQVIQYSKTNVANYDAEVKDLENEFEQIVKSNPDSEKRDIKIARLLSDINYSQIGVALKLVDSVKFKYAWDKYSFIERDFGFFMDDFESPETRKTFLDYYTTYNEHDVYAHYLARAEINYLKPDSSFDYDKIYELLKYDVVDAFVGGGGGKEDNEVYALVKLLELKFQTTLGFPNKLCNSAGLYGCDPTDRSKAWQEYLIDHKLLKLAHNTPESFTFH